MTPDPYEVPARAKVGRYPLHRVPSLKPRSNAVGDGFGAPLARPLRDLRVLISSSGHAGVLGRALEASRCLAERGAEVCVVQAPSAQHLSAAVRGVVARFPFATLIDGESLGQGVAPPTDTTDTGEPRSYPRSITLCASPHVCLDARSVDVLMGAIARSRGHIAVAPALVGPGGKELPALSALAVPLVWMARSATLAESACDGPTSEESTRGDTAAAVLRVERLRSATVLVPRPGEVPDARAGAEEFQPLAT